MRKSAFEAARQKLEATLWYLCENEPASDEAATIRGCLTILRLATADEGDWAQEIRLLEAILSESPVMSRNVLRANRASYRLAAEKVTGWSWRENAASLRTDTSK